MTQAQKAKAKKREATKVIGFAPRSRMADVPVYSVFAFCKDETGGSTGGWPRCGVWRTRSGTRRTGGLTRFWWSLFRRRGIVWRLRLLGTTVSRRY
jgi:hypothetical protein